MGALAAVYVSYGLAMGIAFGTFVIARHLAARAFRVTGALAPYGEAPPSAFAQARPGARLAVAAVGPLALYLVSTLLLVPGLYFGGAGKPGTALAGVVADKPADLAGVRMGDRIVAVDGARVTEPGEVRSILQRRTGGAAVTITVQRDGRELPLAVTLGANKMIGVEFRADPPTWSEAWRGAPRLLPDTIATLTGPRQVTLAGPVAVSRAAAGRPGTVLLAATMMVAVFVLPLLTLASLLLVPPRPRGEDAPRGPAPAPSTPRPWARLAARFVDCTLLAWAVVVAFRFDRGHAELVGYVVTILLVPLEAIVLAGWGTTPGKWLLGLAVTDTAGGRPRFQAALRRVALVWTYGFAAGLPLGLATTIVAHRRVAKAGSAYWDDLDGFVVTSRDVAVWRRVIAGLVVASGVTLYVFLAARSDA